MIVFIFFWGIIVIKGKCVGYYFYCDINIVNWEMIDLKFFCGGIIWREDYWIEDFF